MLNIVKRLFLSAGRSFALLKMTNYCYLRPVKLSIAWKIPTTSPKI